MRFLPTRIHGMIDYAAAAVLILLPWVLDWPNDVRTLLTILGLGVLAYSLVTAYELGIKPILSVPGHLLLDLLGGIVLIASPLLLSVDDTGISATLIVIGVFEVAASLITQRSPEDPVRQT